LRLGAQFQLPNPAAYQVAGLVPFFGGTLEMAAVLDDLSDGLRCSEMHHSPAPSEKARRERNHRLTGSR
jgi:hypothetical protein